MSNSGNQPSAEDVLFVQEVACLESAQALILLRKWPKPEEAIQHYFEEGAASFKEDTSNRQWQQQDNIPFDMSMSRPNSRNENFSGSYIDLSEAHNQAQNPTYQSEQDEYNRALAASMQDQTLPQQESGVTGSGQQFGPANRSHYDPAQWAVTAVHSSREVVDHPPPAKRRRVAGQPAFMRGSADTEYLGALLTIYHSIPLARNAFLYPSSQVHTYGHDPAWWSGTTDENNKSLSVLTDASQTDGRSRDRRNLICEIQCIMAFLDDTNRAYGSVDALAELRAFRIHDAESSFSRLLERWRDAAISENREEPLTQIFTSVAMKATGAANTPPVQKHWYCLEPPVIRREGQTLVELLDSVVWNDTVTPHLDDIWIEHAAEVFTIRLFDADSKTMGLQLLVDEEWYPDRYLFECREITYEMRQKRMRLFHEIQRLRNSQQRIKEMQLPGGGTLDIRRVLSHAAELAPVASDNILIPEDDPSHPSQKVDIPEMQERLVHLVQKIDSKLRDLELRKTELLNQVRKLMRDLTKPSSGTVHPPRNRYVLQGVSTRPNITYVRKPTTDSLDLLEPEAGPSTISVPEWQWWRIAWKEENSGPERIGRPKMQGPVNVNSRDELTSAHDEAGLYSVQKVEIADVVEAAKTEHDQVVLVYASERAMEIPAEPLSLSLRQFVERDNRAFEEEFHTEQFHDVGSGHDRAVGRGRSWSQGTNTTVMDDNDADVDELFPGSGAEHFSSTRFEETERGAAPLRHMTPMSMSTIRDSDGQPSPKRPRSSEDTTPDQYFDDQPPSYEDAAAGDPHEMQEKKGKKIGYFADQLLEKYGSGPETSAGPGGGGGQQGQTAHIELIDSD